MTHNLKRYDAMFRLTCKQDDGSLVETLCGAQVEATDAADAARIVKSDENLTWYGIAEVTADMPEAQAADIEQIAGELVHIKVLDVREVGNGDVLSD